MRRWPLTLFLTVSIPLLMIVLVLGGWYVLRITYVVGLHAANQRVPARGPARSGGGSPADRTALTASTNCVEAGDTLHITATIENTTEYPFTYRGTPPVDIVIEARFPYDAPPVLRWSESDQYPATFSPTIQPGETRTLTWDWQVDPARVGQSNELIIYLRGNELGTPNGGTGGTITQVHVGVGAIEDINNGFYECAELQ